MLTSPPSINGSLSRRTLLRGLAGLLLGLGIESCGQSNSPSVRPAPTPRPHGSLIYSYRGHSERVTTVAWSPDGKYIASGSVDKTVQVWSATNAHVQPVIYRGHTATIRSVAWSPDNKRVVSGGEDMTVHIWEALTGNNAAICQGHTGSVMTVAWSPDGKYVASGSEDKTVHIWEATTGRSVWVYHGHTDSVNSITWSPDSNFLASGSSDTTVHILNVTTGERVFVYRGHSGVVSSVSWSPDGRRLVSGSYDKTAQVWDVLTGKLVYTYQGYNVQEAQANPSKGVLPDLIFVVAWSPTGKRIAAVTQVYCGDICGVIVSWDAETQKNVRFYVDMPVFALAWSPDDTRFVTATQVTTQGSSVTHGVPVEDGPYAQISLA